MLHQLFRLSVSISSLLLSVKVNNRTRDMVRDTTRKIKGKSKRERVLGERTRCEVGSSRGIRVPNGRRCPVGVPPFVVIKGVKCYSSRSLFGSLNTSVLLITYRVRPEYCYKNWYRLYSPLFLSIN